MHLWSDNPFYNSLPQYIKTHFDQDVYVIVYKVGEASLADLCDLFLCPNILSLLPHVVVYFFRLDAILLGEGLYFLHTGLAALLFAPPDQLLVYEAAE